MRNQLETENAGVSPNRRCATLADAFWNYVETSPSAPAIVFAGQGGGISIDRADLATKVSSAAVALRAFGIRRGDRLILALETSIEFAVMFWAIQSLGAAVVPVPSIEGGKRSATGESLGRICQIAKPALVLADSLADVDHDAVERVPIALPSEFMGQSDERFERPKLSSSDLAILQFTSGSTGRPRGCALTNAAVLGNALGLADRITLKPFETVVSWLPLFHDMGLMTGIMLPIVAGAGARLRSPSRFIANPISWLEDLSASGRAHTGVPNFALALTLQRLNRRTPKQLDLSQVVSLVCGSEPIDPHLVTLFMTALAPFGLRREAMHSAYGMAEATLMVTSRPNGLATTRIAGSERSDDDREFVNLGKPIPGVEVRIVDEHGIPLPSGTVGDIEIKSASLMTAYYEDPAATTEVMTNGWFRTGDTGFVVGAELFVVGRRKEIIIVAGRNIYPTDIEYAVSRSIGVLPSRVAAIGREGKLGTETITLVLEMRGDRDRSETIQSAMSACYSTCGVVPKHVLIVPSGRIPRTTSGKIRRGDLRRAVASGELVSEL